MLKVALMRTVLLLVFLAAAAPADKPERPGQVERNVRTQYYDVEGRTARELLQALRAKRPDDYFGETAYQISFEYRTRRQGNLCTLVDPVVRLEVVMTLPRWQPGHGVSQVLKQDWAHFIRRLEQHEGQHLRLAEQGAQEVQNVLATAQGSCATLGTFVGERAQRIMERYDRLNRAYDTRTENGMYEGAHWPVRR